ncbi:hypothetical protein GG851_23540 [Bordetella petrii]|nr:hypothetical protein [Bordetella petrii]
MDRHLASTGQSGDEIDLMQLFKQLWRGRAWVMGVAAVASALAAVYVFGFAPVVYETRVVLLPPSPSDLAAYTHAYLNSEAAYRHSTQEATPADTNPAISPLTSEQAYRGFLTHLASAQLRERFFDEVYLQAGSSVQSNAKVFAHMFKAIDLRLPSPGSQETVLTWRGEEPEKIATWANQFVAMAISAAQRQLKDDLVSELATRLRSVRAQMDTERQVGHTERRAQIVRTQEALRMAQALGLDNGFEAQGVLIVDDGNALPYSQGSKALQAKLAALRTRQDDDPWLDALAPLRRTESLLRDVVISVDAIGVAHVDAAAAVPHVPVAPRHALIMSAACVLGLLLGCGVALVRASIEQTRIARAHAASDWPAMGGSKRQT